jgi:hypothetical protein
VGAAAACVKRGQAAGTSSGAARNKSRRVILDLKNPYPIAQRFGVQLFKKIEMLVAEKAALDAVYCPIAVIPVANVVPFSSVCSCVMNAE